MTISTKTHKMLWGRAAGRCSHPDCRSDLFEDETESDDPTHIGENCHIVAEKDDGPRGDVNFPVERRNLYGNLILLCRNHHKIIDAQENTYKVTLLHKMKADHEAWVRDQLGVDAKKQKDDEEYAAIIDGWSLGVDVDNWSVWTSWVLGPHPIIGVDIDHKLFQLRGWLLSRVWPGRYPELEAAFLNFRLVLNDFYNTLHEHLVPCGGDQLRVKAFYQCDDYDDGEYSKLLARFEYHVDLIHDLMFELTRAANLVCDRIRECVVPSFRRAGGYLLVDRGMTEDLKQRTYLFRYQSEELVGGRPYPGLPAFLDARAQRDVHIGRGRAP